MGCSVALAFFAVGYAHLEAAHPTEDAYILFRYAENLAAGHGITYNPDGPPTEGATDFLWLLLLAGSVRLGLDVALAALLWNSAGAGLAAALIAAPVAQPAWPRWVGGAMLCLPLSVLLYSGAIASYSGFSVVLYSALAVSLVALLEREPGLHLLAIPPLGLALGLFRPDGVLVGVVVALLGFPRAARARLAGPYLATCAACAAFGIAYFLWRWNYFGLLLPLPLYVKGYASALLPGAGRNRAWLTDPHGPLPLLGALAALVLPSRLRREGGTGRLLLLLLPAAALFAELAFAAQYQNFLWRFQAPIFLMVLFVLACASGRNLRASAALRHRLAVVGLAAGAVAIPVVQGARDVHDLLSREWGTYLETFAPVLGSRLGPERVLAVTEAGVLSYWTDATVRDVVGLNDARAALRPTRVDDLREIDPDVVLLRHMKILDWDKLRPPDAPQPPVLEVEPGELEAAVRPGWIALYRGEVADYEAVAPPVAAALTLLRFLAETEAYDIVLADYRLKGKYHHVFGFRRGWPLRDRMVAELEASLRPERYRSYLELKRARASGRWPPTLLAPSASGGSVPADRDDATP